MKKTGNGWSMSVTPTKNAFIVWNKCCGLIPKMNRHNNTFFSCSRRHSLRMHHPSVPVPPVTRTPSPSKMKAVSKNSDSTKTQLFILFGLGVTVLFIFGFAILFILSEKNHTVTAASPTSSAASSANNTSLPTQVQTTPTQIPRICTNLDAASIAHFFRDRYSGPPDSNTSTSTAEPCQSSLC